jgi:hypothetical protein
LQGVGRLLLIITRRVATQPQLYFLERLADVARGLRGLQQTARGLPDAPEERALLLRLVRRLEVRGLLEDVVHRRGFGGDEAPAPKCRKIKAPRAGVWDDAVRREALRYEF